MAGFSRIPTALADYRRMLPTADERHLLVLAAKEVFDSAAVFGAVKDGADGLYVELE